MLFSMVAFRVWAFQKRELSSNVPNMKASGADLCSICRDGSSASKLLRKLSAQTLPHQSRQAVFIAAWIEDQVRVFSKATASRVATNKPTEPPAPSAPLSQHPVASITKLPQSAPADAGDEGDDKLGELKGLTIGGIKIGVKQKQQKKRMTPSLMAQTPNINQVKGNINSVTGAAELADIRAELQRVASLASTPAVTEERTALPTASLTVVVQPSKVAAQEIPRPISCVKCAGEEDGAAVRRMAALYATLALHQHLALLQAVSLVQLALSIDPVLATDTVVCTCSPTDEAVPESAVLLRTGQGVKTFTRELVEQLLPVLAASGLPIACEIVESPALRVWGPDLAVRLRDALVAQGGGGGADKSQQYNISFKMPETFLKPFREETDSKNEFKTQAELAVFYERERLYDQFSNLFFRFQGVARGDLDGSATAQFFRTDLLTTGAIVMSMKEANYWWFADVFMRQMLFYGTSTAPAAAVFAVPTTNSANGTDNKVAPSDPIYAAFSASKADDVDYSAQFPVLGGKGPATPAQSPAAGTAVNVSTAFSGGGNVSRSSVPLDLTKQSKLEARLGFGGEVKPAMVRSSGQSAAGSHYKTPGTGPRNNGPNTAYTRKPYGDKRGPGQPGASTPPPPAGGRSGPDVYEQPSKQFSGSQQFFFRYLVGMNNARLNQCLLACIFAEITALVKNADTTRAFGGFLPASQAGVGEGGSSDRESTLTPENFALMVAKLKILGRFLGALLFSHMWSSPAAEQQAQLGPFQPTIAVRALLEEAVQQRRLCLCVPWVVEVLKMVSWVPALVAAGSGEAQKRDGAADGAGTRLVRTVPYADCFVYLRSVQYSPAFHPLTSQISSNRTYVLSEIQGLWASLPSVFVAAVASMPLIEIARSSRAASRDLTPNIDRMLSGGDLGLDLGGDEGHHGLDDRNLAFSAVFMHHVAPAFETVYTALRTGRSVSARGRAAIVATQKKVKRQTPSVMTPESLALREALIKPALAALSEFPPPPPPPGLTTESSTSAPLPPQSPQLTNRKTVAAPAEVLTTPSKPRRSQSTGTAPTSATARPAKSPRSKAATGKAGATNHSEISEESFRSPTKARTARAPSFDALSPSFGGNMGMSPRTTGETRYRPPSSTTNSITTSGRTSPSVTLFGGRAHRSYSDIQNGGFIIRQPSFGSPTKGAMQLMLSPLKMGDLGYVANDLADVMERLELAFWNQHLALQDMSFRLLDHVKGACLAQNRERVGAAMRELVTYEFSLRSEADAGRFKDQLEAHTKRMLYSTVSEGEQFIEEFISKFTKTTLVQMLQLYPVNPRVLKMAVHFINRHFHAEKAPLLAHLKDYCARKMNALCVLSANLHEKRAAEAARAGNSRDAESEAPAASGFPQVDLQGPVGAVTLVDQQHHDTSTSAVLEELSQHFELDGCSDLKTLLTRPVSATLRPDLLRTKSASSLRNSLASLLSALTQYVTLLARWATGGSTHIDVAVSNLVALHDLAFQATAHALTDMDLTLTATRWAELSGKVATDVAKYLTAVALPVMHVDAMVAERGTGPARASDIVLLAVETNLITVEALCRLLSAVVRPKNASYFETCRGLVGLKAALNSTVLAFVRRLLMKQHPELSSTLNLGSEEAWYADMSVRAAVRATAGESVAGLIATLMAGV